MRRLYLELKNLRFYYFVPLVVLFVLVPLTVIASVKQYGPSFPSFTVICQLYIPCFSPWWPLFVLKDYLNSPGKELLFVYKQRRDSLLGKTVVLWVLYVLHILVVFFAATFLYDFVWFLFVAVVIQSMFLTALAYFLAILLQNTFVPLITTFTYSLIFMLAGGYSPLNIFTQGLNDASSLDKSVFVFIAAVIFFYVGYQMEKRLYKNSI
jgi:hypothetical protein